MHMHVIYLYVCVCAYRYCRSCKHKQLGQRHLRRVHGDTDGGKYHDFHSSAIALFCRDDKEPMSSSDSEVSNIYVAI